MSRKLFAALLPVSNRPCRSVRCLAAQGVRVTARAAARSVLRWA